MGVKKCKSSLSTKREKPIGKSGKASKIKTNGGSCNDSGDSCLSLPILTEKEGVEEPRAIKSRGSLRRASVTGPVEKTALKTVVSERKANTKPKNNKKCPDVFVKLWKLDASKLFKLENKNEPKLNQGKKNKKKIAEGSYCKAEAKGSNLLKAPEKEKDVGGYFINLSSMSTEIDDFNCRQKIKIVIGKVFYETIFSLLELNFEHVEETTKSCKGEQKGGGCENNNKVTVILKFFGASFYFSEYEFDFIDIDNNILKDNNKTITSGDEELLEKLKENLKQNKKETTNKSSNLNSDSNFKSKDLEETKDNELSCLNKYPYASLQDIMDKFIKNPKLNCVEGVLALKKGLCLNWLANNYVCSNQNCMFSHNASNFFSQQLKNYPSNFIMILTMSMRKDELFVDMIMAALKLFHVGQTPIAWITFLVYFVFYVTDPSDCRFLKFWASAARFFVNFNKDSSADKGFASLLSIFSQSRESEEWKIIEFVKLITKPPIQIRVTYSLLQPILKMDIPIPLLADAVESCVKTQDDVLNVYLTIIPRLPLMTLPVCVIELLLKLSKTLETMNEEACSQNLKLKLRQKIQAFKTKILNHKFPLTASFQQELWKSCSRATDEPIASSSEQELEYFTSSHNYIDPLENFFNERIQAEALNSTSVDIKNDVTKLATPEEHVDQMKQFFKYCRFDLLGKQLNQLKEDAVLPVAEEFLKLLFQTKMSLKQLVYLVKIIVFSCKTQNSAKVIGCICKTLILNLVKIMEWDKAHMMVSLCCQKQINILEGKVFVSNKKLVYASQFRVALMLVEIHAYKQNYQKGLDIIKKYNLFSANSSLWKLPSNEDDENARVKVLEQFLWEIIYNELADMVYDLFDLIWKEQKDLDQPVDLGQSVSQVLILLLNQDNEEALNFFEKIKSEVELSEITNRAILVTLVRHNKLIEAKNLLNFHSQKLYILPKVFSDFVVLEMSSFWLEEEIYLMIDALFDLLAAWKQENVKSGYQKQSTVQVNINLSKKKTSSAFSPLCLSLVNPSFTHACMRIQRVLQTFFSPPVSVHITSTTFTLDNYSLQVHLNHRIQNQPPLSSFSIPKARTLVPVH